MLALTDPRWASLGPFFGEGADIPRAIERWLGSMGTDAEQDAYFDHLFELFLHQETITDAAIAVVPWLMHACTQLETRHRAMYLAHVAMVEANRLEYGVPRSAAGSAGLFDDLMPDYRAAIGQARAMADDLIGLRPEDATEHGLVALRPALHGDAGLAWKQWHDDWKSKSARASD